MPPSNLPLSKCVSCRRRILSSFGLNLRKSFARDYVRPPTAPKPLLDYRHIRQNPGLYELNCIDRNWGSKSKHSWQIKELFESWQQCQQEARRLRERNNVVKSQMEQIARAGGPDLTLARGNLLREARELKSQISTFEEREREYMRQMEVLALELPNLSSTETPVGDEPEVLGMINPQLAPLEDKKETGQVSHVDIGTKLDILDFAAAASTSGWGYYYLKNEAALLEQALIQYAIDTAMAKGWQVVSPPSMVYEHMAAACGFQPRDNNGEEQIYSIEQSEKDKERGKLKMVMAGTAEIPLAAMKAKSTIKDVDLPLKVIGVNRSYRAEAGGRGVDTKGLYRVHEFTKVELFAWAMPDSPSKDSDNSGGNFDTQAPAPSGTNASDIFKEMLALQTEILQSLDLHCRILNMPTADLGASASKKIDIEAFFPSRVTLASSQGGWGELSSLSLCTDYQSRRLSTRVQIGKEGRLDYPWTLNGTAMAVPRVIAALLENGWRQEEGVVVIPEVLRKYLGQRKVIGSKQNIV